MDRMRHKTSTATTLSPTPTPMATAVLHHHNHLLLLSPPPRQSHLSFLPRVPPPPPRLRCSFPFTRRLLASYAEAKGEEEGGDFVVVSFYKFVLVDEPHDEVANHLRFLQGRDIHGRIYMNEQGINAQYSGPRKDAMAYAGWLREDPRFCDILVQTSPSLRGHAFPRLKVRYKQSLVQLEGGSTHLPLVDPNMRATPLAPSEWRERLQARKCFDVSSRKADRVTSERKFLLLDVRNDYEWDIGHFQGAQRPNVDCFRSTSFGQSEQEMDSSDPLNDIDEENTDILMYCTGGIRCDVYSTILRKKGFQNLYTLSGGVSNYLKIEGSAEWVGNLFVFDGRLSLPPSMYKPTEEVSEKTHIISSSSSLGRCYVCGSVLLEFRHRNCASIDCNRLYLCCDPCVEELRGCCCSDCKTAPRLRPLLSRYQRYKKWHVYRDGQYAKETTTAQG